MPVILKLVTGTTIRRPESKRLNRGVILHDLGESDATAAELKELEQLQGIDGFTKAQIAHQLDVVEPFLAIDREAFDTYVENNIHPHDSGFKALLQRIHSTQTDVERQASTNPEIDGSFVRVISPGLSRHDDYFQVVELQDSPQSNDAAMPLDRLIGWVANWFGGPDRGTSDN